MNFGQSISHCFSNYFNFNGRSSRSEFWWFELFAVALSVLGSVWDASMGDSSGYGMMYLLFTAATFFPIIAVGARRLHDVGKIRMVAITYNYIHWINTINNLVGNRGN